MGNAPGPEIVAHSVKRAVEAFVQFHLNIDTGQAEDKHKTHRRSCRPQKHDHSMELTQHNHHTIDQGDEGCDCEAGKGGGEFLEM